jgi:hypothetical protein
MAGPTVQLVEADKTTSGVYETPRDYEDEDGQPWDTWRGPEGSFPTPREQP